MSQPADSSIRDLVSLSFTLPALVVVLLFILSGGFEKILEVKSSHVIPLGNLQLPQITDLWFSPSNSLFATYHQDLRVFLFSWDPVPKVRLIDFGKVAGKGLVSSIANSFDHRVDRTNPRTTLSYAISNDGSRVLWSWENRLIYGPVDKFPQGRSLMLAPPLPVMSVSFLGSDLALVAQAESLFTWNLATATRLGGTKTEAKPWSIWSRGPSVLWAPGGTSAFLFLKLTKAKPYFLAFQPKSGGTCISVSSSGDRALLGTREGLIITYRNIVRPEERRAASLEGQGLDPYVAIEGLGTITALAAYDDTFTIAAGSRPGLYVIKQGLQAERLLATSPGVRLIAVSTSKLAYVTDNTLVLAEIETSLRLNEKTKFPITLMFSIIGFIAFLRVAIVDVVSILQRRRAAKKAGVP